MSEKLIPSTEEAWDERLLGADESFVRVADAELTRRLDESLGMHMISIRLPKELIGAFKYIGEFHGVGYQPLMRDALERFAKSEVKCIFAGLVKSQKDDGQVTPPETKRRKVA
jgi:hypothetical protein